MRLRWIALAFVLFGSVMAVYAVCHESGGAVDTVVGMCRRVGYGMLFGVGYWGASHVLQRIMNQPQPVPAAVRGSAPPAPPVPMFEVKEPTAGEGRYRVHGMDRETHFEICEVVYADSPSNAQMKVELKGVDVAVVERAG